ncbi:MAG: hypothetical protein AAF108_05885 [Planctomycetota bacterium]
MPDPGPAHEDTIDPAALGTDQTSRFEDDVFRAIAADEPASGVEGAGVAGAIDAHRDHAPGTDAKPSTRKGSVREAIGTIDHRLNAVGDWLGHLEGVEPVEVWEDDPDEHGRLLGLRTEGDALKGWKLEVAVGPSQGSSDWSPPEVLSVAERVRALALTQHLLREVVEHQRRLIAQIRAAVKEFDAAAAAMGVRVGR